MLRLIYIANIIVAGWISISSLFFPAFATVYVFANAYAETEVMRLVGCLWLGIAVLSALGLRWPLKFVPVLLLQLVYKGTWLLVVALPAFLANKPFPGYMALFFMVWLLFLPIAIPWRRLFEKP